MIDIGSKFDLLKDDGKFVRISAEHPINLRIGRDEQGRKALELRLSLGIIPRNVPSTKSIEIGRFTNTKLQFNTLRFSLLNERIQKIFYAFCEDIYWFSMNAIDEETGHKLVCDRYLQWKNAFSNENSGLLSESMVMGLIGELYYFDEYLGKSIGVDAALSSWAGPDKAKKDFSYNDTWTEVKTIKAGSLSVTISSLEQLESDIDGKLGIVVLEKMSENYYGLTLNEFVHNITLKLSDNQYDLFKQKLQMYGYFAHPKYDDYIYEVRDYQEYLVNESFPRVCKNILPKAVSRVKYDLLLSEIDLFKIK